MNRTAPGIGLVEVIVALTIFSTSLLGLAAVTAVAHKALSNAARLEQGTRIAAAALDSLMRENDPADGSVDYGGVSMAWTVRGDSIVLVIEPRASTPDGLLVFTAVHRAH